MSSNSSGPSNEEERRKQLERLTEKFERENDAPEIIEPTKFRRRFNLWVNGLCVYQIICGVLGIVFFIPHLDFRTENQIFSFIAIAFNILSIVAGVQLYRNISRGLLLTKLNQGLQLISIAIGSFFYRYISGLGISLVINMTQTFTYGIELKTPTFSLHLNNGEDNLYFAFNLVAWFLLFKTNRLSVFKKRLNESELANQNK